MMNHEPTRKVIPLGLCFRMLDRSDLGNCARTYSVRRVPQSQDHCEWLGSCAAVPDADSNGCDDVMC